VKWFTPGKRARVECSARHRDTAVIGLHAEAKGKNHITFAGLNSATTCVAGPVGGGRPSGYHLRWEPASDKNRHSPIVYEIYQATSRGGEHFSKPTYTTALGVTSFDRSCGFRAPTRRDGETSSETPCADAQS
jgi:hypothetical protein